MLWAQGFLIPQRWFAVCVPTHGRRESAVTMNQNVINFKTLYNIFREISTVVHSSISVDEVIELVVWRTAQVLGAKGAVFRSLNRETKNLEMFASYGLGKKYLSKAPVSNPKTIIELCSLSKAVVIEDILTDSRVQNPQEIWDEGIRMILDIPLTIREDLFGILRIYLSELRKLSQDEMDLLVAIADVCACAIDKARLIEEIQARYDHLALHTEKLSALGRMAAGIAHEINNPLGGILLFSSNIRKKVPEEGPIKEGLEVIIREALRCKGIIQDLLEFSRDKDPKKVMGSINQIIDRSLDIMSNEFQLNRISIDKDLANDMPDVLLDVNLMQQVFVNLFINAVEAIQENGKISIRSCLSSDQDSELIEITDTGSGIQPNDVPKIFEPFFSTKANGTGLGLAVSFGIVKKHDGNIQVSSQPGIGTRFIITIPLCR
jgi:signal transduction histidine kinase